MSMVCWILTCITVKIEWGASVESVRVSVNLCSLSLCGLITTTYYCLPLSGLCSVDFVRWVGGVLAVGTIPNLTPPLSVGRRLPTLQSDYENVGKPVCLSLYYYIANYFEVIWVLVFIWKHIYQIYMALNMFDFNEILLNNVLSEYVLSYLNVAKTFCCHILWPTRIIFFAIVNCSDWIHNILFQVPCSDYLIQAY